MLVFSRAPGNWRIVNRRSRRFLAVIFLEPPIRHEPRLCQNRPHIGSVNKDSYRRERLAANESEEQKDSQHGDRGEQKVRFTHSNSPSALTSSSGCHVAG